VFKVYRRGFRVNAMRIVMPEEVEAGRRPQEAYFDETVALVFTGNARASIALAEVRDKLRSSWNYLGLTVGSQALVSALLSRYAGTPLMHHVFVGPLVQLLVVFKPYLSGAGFLAESLLYLGTSTDYLPSFVRYGIVAWFGQWLTIMAMYGTVSAVGYVGRKLVTLARNAIAGRGLTLRDAQPVLEDFYGRGGAQRPPSPRAAAEEAAARNAIDAAYLPPRQRRPSHVRYNRQIYEPREQRDARRNWLTPLLVDVRDAFNNMGIAGAIIAVELGFLYWQELFTWMMWWLF
jgi:hypothetical protein